MAVSPLLASCLPKEIIHRVNLLQPEVQLETRESVLPSQFEWSCFAGSDGEVECPQRKEGGGVAEVLPSFDIILFHFLLCQR